MNSSDGTPTQDDRHDALKGMAAGYGRALWRYCYGQLADRHLAEDAAQEAFLRVHRALANGQPKDLSTWLFGVARRCCQEMNRRRRRPAEQALSLKGDTASPATDPGRLEALLEELDDRERSLVYLKHVEGLKCREIAERIGKPLGTVTGDLARAYQKLRTRLHSEGQ